MLKGTKIENKNDITLRVSDNAIQYLHDVQGFEVVQCTSKKTGKEYTINKIYCNGVTISIFGSVITKQIEELDENTNENIVGDWIITSKQSKSGNSYIAMYKCKNEEIPF